MRKTKAAKRKAAKRPTARATGTAEPEEARRGVVDSDDDTRGTRQKRPVATQAVKKAPPKRGESHKGCVGAETDGGVATRKKVVAESDEDDEFDG